MRLHKCVVRNYTHYVKLITFLWMIGGGRSWFWSRSGQTKDYYMCMGCFSAKYAPLRNKNKDWFALNHYNFQRGMFMSTRGLLIHWASNISYSACWSSTARTSSSSSHWIVTSSRHLIARLALNNNHSQKGYQFCIVGIKTTIYHPRNEHASHRASDVVIRLNITEEFYLFVKSFIADERGCSPSYMSNECSMTLLWIWVIATDCIGSCRSKYHALTTTSAPWF
jgi:hypothetical protein